MRGRVGLLAAIGLAATLLACDGCRTQAVEDDGPDSREARSSVLACEPLAPRVLASAGQGPVALAAGDDVLSLLFDAGRADEPALTYLELDRHFQVLEESSLVAATAGPLLPAALARVDGAVAAVAQPPSARRAFLFSRRAPDPFTLVETPALGGLDRRVGISLLAPRTGGGVQVVSHVSGTGQVEVGRLAGSLFVSRGVEVPSLPVMPAAEAGFQGGIALATTETLPGGRRLVRLRELGPDGSIETEVVVADVGAAGHVESIAVAGADDRYLVAWLEREGEETTLHRVEVDADTGLAATTIPITANAPGAVITRMSLAADDSRIWIGWVESDDAGDWLWVTAERPGAPEPWRFLAHERRGGRIESLAIDVVAGGLALAWRERERGATGGEVLAAIVRCR